MRILSGIQPSGALHLGNYFGMMQKMIGYQERGDLFCFIVNLHALTSVFDGKLLSRNTLEAAMDFLALGLDPDRCYFWVQSDIAEHAELAWILSNYTPMGLLQRGHSYKDKVARGLQANAGLFTYPVLMAADILLYQSDVVPVGKDQKQHVEMARDIAIKFNNAHGGVFTVPEVEIDADLAIVPGIDGRKMSKSYGNVIEIFEDEESLRKKVMSIQTDSAPVEQPKDPDVCNLFALYKLFADADAAATMAERYRAGGLKYVEVKKELVELIREFFAPYRDKRDAFADDPGQVVEILDRGAQKARAVAQGTMDKVRQAIGLKFRPE